MSEFDNKDDLQRKFAESYGADSMGGGLGLEGLRLSPSQYLSSASAEGARQGFIEILQNGIDEALALASFLSKNGVKDIPKFLIEMKIYLDDTVVIKDTGRGVPADYSEKFKRPVLEVAFEENNVGGKGKGYVKNENSAYQNRGIGKHGSGGACTNATSDFFQVDSYVQKDGKHYRARWEEAKKTLPTTEVGPSGDRHGTEITFRPSKDVFELYSDTRGEVDRFYDEDELVGILTEYAFTTDNIMYSFSFQQPDETWRLHEIDADKHKREERLSANVKGDIVNAKIENEQLKFSLDVTMGLSNGILATHLSCNKLKMKGGTHLRAINDALDGLYSDVLKYINMFYESQGIDKIILPNDIGRLNVPKPSDFVSKDISIEMDHPEYTGQTKQELNVPRVKKQIEDTFKQLLDTDLEQFKISLLTEIAKRYINELESAEALRAQQEAKAERARREKERNELLGKGRGKNKLNIRGMDESQNEMVYARNPNNKDVILYIVEGKTGVEKMKSVRNVDNEAILPIIWAVPNVFTKTFDQLMRMPQFKFLYRALAGDGRNIGNYKGVVIVTDPDAYGMHIKAKLVSLICMYFPRYIEQGRLFFLNVPKFVGYSSADANGDKPIYFAKQEEFREHRDDPKNSGKFRYSNYKGLGSIPNKLLSKLVSDRNAVQKLDPDTYKEGLNILKVYLSDTEFKKKYITQMYGDQSLIEHIQHRREILNYHEVEFDVNDIDAEFVETPDLSDVRRFTSREQLQREILDREGLDIDSLVREGWTAEEIDTEVSLDDALTDGELEFDFDNDGE